MMRLPFLFLPLFLYPFHFKAQTDTIPFQETEEDTVLTNAMMDNLEMQAEYTGNETDDYTELTAGLFYYAAHPLVINTAAKEELEALGMLSDYQIFHLLKHIQDNGKLQSIYELQTIAGFDVFTIRLLLPYIRIDNRSKEDELSLANQFKKISQRLSIRYGRVLEQQQGYQASDTTGSLSKNLHYLGSPDKILIRYTIRFGNLLQFGFTARKDAGESFFQGVEKQGFDFYSSRLCIRHYHQLKMLVIGDYTLSFGQGLLAWTGLSFSHTADALFIKKSGAGIQPHAASSKNGFLRGTAASIGVRSFDIIVFASVKKLDATITDTTQNGQPLTIRTIQTSGLHATLSEIAAKNTIQQDVAGTHLGVEKPHYGFGVSYCYTRFNASIEPRDVPYEQFSFRGRQLEQAATDYHLLYRNINMFGEAAASLDQTTSYSHPGTAIVQGILLAPDARFNMSLLYRNYSPSYHSFTSNAFAEGGRTNNEQGVYLGSTFKPESNLEVSSYTDYFQYPWLRYRINSPAGGSSYFIQANYILNKKTEISFRFRKQDKPLDPTAALQTDEINYPQTITQINYRARLLSKINPWLRWQSRIEWIYLKDSIGNEEKGFLILQELSIRPKRNYTISISYSLFDTPSGNVRIYTYQHAVPGDYSIPSFSGRGSNVSTLIRYKIIKGLELWGSISRLFYDDRTIISPGTADAILASHKTEIALEISWKF
jgi:hypothetical protein